MEEQPLNPYDYSNEYLNQYGITDVDGFRKSQKRNQVIYEKVFLTAYQNLTGSAAGLGEILQLPAGGSSEEPS